ncbi:MAG: bifunctional 4-hydroxy-3-methylbut-2-enyl diphosphate reductase/30S ribosomal protein S1 [Clostridia bacterium]|nr:bifunctional 4-hydroxy-3-methylbut-2-enyl diphosphate reductase/30S ribosomal protein S1 [Clostridia bacterium]
MKEIRTASTAGFCFGVRRAVSAVEKAAGSDSPLFTFGELIHNEHVVRGLQDRGVRIIDSAADLPPGGAVTVAVRSHGVAPGVYRELEAAGARILDLTCPFVRRIHRRVQKAAGRQVLVVGAASHPEVQGICGWAGGGCRVLESPKQARRLGQIGPALIVAQTTVPRSLFTAVVDAVDSSDLEVFDSICDTTQRRQEEAKQLARSCDLMIVIGGGHSSNTAKLRDICTAEGTPALRVAGPDDPLLEKVKDHDIIGIIAGASTPDWLIREVKARMSEVENVQDTVVLDGEAATVTDVAAETVDAAADTVTEAAAETTEAAAEEPAAAEVVAVAAEEEESDDDASKTDDEDFMAEIEKSFVFIKRGQIVTGTVVQVSENEICVNIGYKSDGILRRENLTPTGDANPLELFKEGDEIEAEVLTLNDGEGNVVLSRKSIESKLKWKELLDSMDEDQIYTVKVDKVVKGGVLAKLEGYDAFIPASQLSLKYVEDLTQFVGQDLEVNMIEVDRRQRRFVLSHKKVLQKRREEEEKRLYDTFHKGDKVTGKVKRLTDFGAFVDIGGVDGLLHVTDISWTKVKHPQDVLSVGQEVEVLILNVDPERHRISLGLKQLQPKPWDLVPEKYIKGDTVEGTVVRIMPFGAFVSLEPTIDGLIHISQVTTRRLERVEEELHIGDKVTAKILDVDPAKKRISLSLRALMEDSRPPRERRERRGGGNSDRGSDYDRGGYDYKLPPVQNVTVSVADAFGKAEEAKED